MEIAGKIETGWSFVMADQAGDIGFQMSGKVPVRKKGISGFVPLPGWKKENDWPGFISYLDLPRIKNPEEGYFATSNQDLNAYGKATPINMPMGKYRSDRAGQLLSEKHNITKEEMFLMHQDVYSLQAEIYMKILKPLLPDTEQGNILKAWDYCYDADSKGAFLFEQFYKQLYLDVFGKNGFGESVIGHLEGDTGIFIDFYNSFDRVLLKETSVWFGDKSRDELFKASAAKALDIIPEKWGKGRDFMLTHILFGGKLPLFTGFDRGPITGIGGRATIHQGQIYKSAGRKTTFMPSIRMVSDLADTICHTNMTGGPSDRRFSKWYCSDLDNWLHGRYKELNPDGTGRKLKF
jgi:penicillin amidase